MAVIEDGAVNLQFDLEPGESLPGSEEHFTSAVRSAVVGRLSLSAAVRATAVLPYAVEVRIDDLVGEPSGGQPREFAIAVMNDPDSPLPFSRFAVKGVSLVRREPTVSDDVVLQFEPGEYFFELRRGSSWREVEHPVALNRVSFFAERQAAAAAAAER